MAALVAFAVTTWKLNIRSLSCVPSPFGIGKPVAQPRSNAVMIGQNRQAALEQAKADHDYTDVNNLLVENTELTAFDPRTHRGRAHDPLQRCEPSEHDE